MYIKKRIRNYLRKIGYDIIRYDYYSDSNARFIELLDRFKINLLMDVGANEGQYGSYLRDIGYKDRIISFEPVSVAYTLLNRKAQNDRLWKCEQIGLGTYEGKTVINIAGNSQSSSLLNMLPKHIHSAPDSSYIGKEEINLSTIDIMMKKYFQNNDKVFLKIDAQGYEKHIIEGANLSLALFQGIQIEMSLIPLYEGEILFPEMYAYLCEKGFTLMSLEPVFFSQVSGELLQVNGLFFRINS